MDHRAPPADQPPVVPGFQHVRRFWLPDPQIWIAKVLPGQYYISRGGEWIETVLGSCISACVRDPVLGLGGMNHFMLPEAAPPDRWGDGDAALAQRYGSHAMANMITDLLRLGAERRRLEAKIVGGAQVLAHLTDVGARNVGFVREFLARESITLAGESLGGEHPRKVRYDVVSGRVRVKRLPLPASLRVAEAEFGHRRVVGGVDDDGGQGGAR